MAKKILFIIVDQLRADCLNGALADAVAMPNIRALMEDGVTFNRHYANIVPCGPSRASLLTGLYAMNHRSVQNGAPLSASHPTIATEMRKAGYEPMLFGYTDTSVDPHGLHPKDPDLRTYEGVARGFNEMVRMCMGPNSTWEGYLKNKGYDLPENYWDIYKPVAQSRDEKYHINDPALYTAPDSDTAFLTDRSLEELAVRTNMDWFSTITYIRPHPPFVAPAPYNNMYPVEKLPAPHCPNSLEAMGEDHPFHKAYFSAPSNHVLYRGFNGEIDKLNREKIDQIRSVYFGLITELDDHVGRLVEHLKSSGQYDDTLIVFTADHGEMLGDHHMWGKNTPFNASFHVPLIVCDPNNRDTAGTQINHFTESIDVAPTILDWVGLEQPLGFNGHSLMPWIRGDTPKNWRTHWFGEMDMGDNFYGLRYQKTFGTQPRQTNFAILQDEQYKLVHFNGGVSPLLFDMIKDAGESTNLANDPAHTQTLLKMSQKMLDHRMTHAHHALSRISLTSDGMVSN